MAKIKYWVLVNCMLWVTCAYATIHNVGSGQSYTTPNALYQANALQDGDTIYINAQEYLGTVALANWNKNNLLIRGINGRPHMRANGQYLSGKAIWITSGNNIRIENIEFSECSVPDQNGAGIRAEGPDITIKDCYFHHNENGILTNNPNAGHVDIQHCEFAYNGYGDGQSHNLYVGHVNQLTFKYNYSHHTNVGHNLKTRANINLILYNRIMDEGTGNSSRIIDLPNGGLSIIIGNLLMQGVNAVNNNLIGYGLEGLTNPLAEVYIINNTFLNKRAASCIFIQLQPGTSVAQVVNNVFAGTGTLVNGNTTLMTNNYNSSNIATLMFADEPNYDYRLTSTSPAINGGISVGNVYSFSLTPALQYLHPINSIERIPNNFIDIGAYEYGLACTTTYPSYTFNGGYNNQWYNAANWNNDCIPPNPFSGNISINEDCLVTDEYYQSIISGSTITIESGKTLMWK